MWKLRWFLYVAFTSDNRTTVRNAFVSYSSFSFVDFTRFSTDKIRLLLSLSGCLLFLFIDWWHWRELPHSVDPQWWERGFLPPSWSSRGGPDFAPSNAAFLLVSQDAVYQAAEVSFCSSFAESFKFHDVVFPPRKAKRKLSKLDPKTIELNWFSNVKPCLLLMSCWASFAVLWRIPGSTFVNDVGVYSLLYLFLFWASEKEVPSLVLGIGDLSSSSLSLFLSLDQSV